jgi:hypothetical protein
VRAADQRRMRFIPARLHFIATRSRGPGGRA